MPFQGPNNGPGAAGSGGAHKKGGNGAVEQAPPVVLPASAALLDDAKNEEHDARDGNGDEEGIPHRRDENVGQQWNAGRRGNNISDAETVPSCAHSQAADKVTRTDDKGRLPDSALLYLFQALSHA